jgi:alpha-tubulin suppressor-like RCC1 family protein
VRIEGLGDDVVEVKSGGGPACARKRDGTVWCWGRPDFGNVGVPIPPSTSGGLSPVAPPTRVDAISRAVEIAVSDSMSCARLEDGTVSCWGAVQLDPTGYMPISEKPRAIPGVVKAKGLALAQAAGFALAENGAVWAWGEQRGNKDRSALAIVSSYDYVAPTTVASLSDIRAISADEGTACAIRNDERVVCWGDNGQGQLGRGTIGNEAWGAPAEVPDVRVRSLAVGTWSACVETVDGKVVCWGAGGYGALGNGTAEQAPMPPGLPVLLP